MSKGRGMTERREYHTRAETLRRVVAWLRGQTLPAQQVPTTIAPPAAGIRILKRLAMRSLARREPAGWMPTRILVSTIDLQESASAA